MSKELTIEEANEKLKEQIALLEDKSLPLNKAMEIYKDAALTLEQCYKALDGIQGELTDINDRIEKLSQNREDM